MARKTFNYQQLEQPCDDENVIWNAQNVTFAISLAIQCAVLIFSIVTLAIGQKVPEVLTTVLWLETAVQLIEFAWYLVIGILFVWGKSLIGKSCEFGIEYRYIDWVLSTPVMLITLYFLLHYFANHCLTNHQLTEKPSFVGFLVLIVLLDWAMLLVGFAYEREWLGGDDHGWKNVPMLVGFVFLVCAFIPHFVTIGQTPTAIGMTLLVITLVLWMCYGVVAWFWMGKRHGVMSKNAFYNILDLFSKNAVGVTVSILALTYKEAHKNSPCL